MKKLSALDVIALVLVVIGGLNWGLIGAFKFNLVEAVLGNGVLGRLVYILVGFSAVYTISLMFKTDKPAEIPQS